MLISLKKNGAAAVIDTKGAQLLSLKDKNGKEYMWQRDPKFWARTSPVLFPAIGNSRDGKTMFDGAWYELPKHGFAKDMEFEAEKRGEEEVSLTVGDTEETRRHYPYRFGFTMDYRLTDDGIEIRYQVENRDSKDMYYCLGAHPGFVCPMEEGERFEDYRLQFEREEDSYGIVYDLKALEFDRTSRGYHLDHTSVLPLAYELFDSDAIYFEGLKSKRVSLVHTDTGKGVEVSYGDFASVAFWTPGGKEAPVPPSVRTRTMHLPTSMMCSALGRAGRKIIAWAYGFWPEIRQGAGADRGRVHRNFCKLIG